MFAGAEGEGEGAGEGEGGDLRSWLVAHKLGAYADALAEKSSVTTVSALTAKNEDELKSLGKSIGLDALDRNRFVRGILKATGGGSKGMSRATTGSGKSTATGVSVDGPPAWVCLLCLSINLISNFFE